MTKTRFRRIAALVGGLLAAAPVAWSASPWTQYGFDAGRTFHNRAETQLSPANAHELTLLWATNRGTTDIARMGPPLSARGLFLACSSTNGLVSRDLRSGNLVGLADIPTQGDCDAPLLYGASVIAESWGDSITGRLERHDRSGMLWSVSEDVGPLIRPALLGNTVYVRDVSKWVHAFDAATGQLRWQTKVAYIGSDIAVAAGHVVLSVNDAKTGPTVLALDAATGRRVWSVPLDWQTTESLLIADRTVIVQQPNGKLRALDLQTGTQIWHVRVSRGGGALAATGNTLYRAESDRVTALDLRTGAERWRSKLGADRIRTSENIVLANGMLYYMAMDSLSALEQYLVAVNAATGEVVTRVDSSPVDGTGARLIVADGLVQVVSDRRGMMAVYGLPAAEASRSARRP